MALRGKLSALALEDALPKMFSRAQDSSATHKNVVVQLEKLRGREDVSQSKFHQLFVTHLARLFVLEKQEPCAERLLKFIGAFFNATKDDALVRNVMRVLQNETTSENKNTRMRVISAIITLFDISLDRISSLDGDESEDSILDSLYEALHKRLFDKEIKVRCLALTAYGYFHAGDGVEEEEGGDDDLSNDFVQLYYDSSRTVQKTLLSRKNFWNKTSLPHFIAAAGSDHADLRLQFYRTARSSRVYKLLSPSQRLAVMRDGLSDSSEAVRKECRRMILEGWIKGCMKGDLMKFLSGIDVVEGEKAVEKVLDVYMSENYEEERVNLVKINWTEHLLKFKEPHAVVYRVLCSFAVKQGDEETMERILPDLGLLEQTLRFYFGELGALETSPETGESKTDVSRDLVFVTSQFIKLALGAIDLGEEIGSRNLKELLWLVLPVEDLVPSIVVGILDLLRKLAGSLVSDKQDLTRRVAAEVVMAVVEKASEAESKDDKIFYFGHALTVAESLLQSWPLSSTDAILTTWRKQLFGAALGLADGEVREQACRCIGLVSVLSVDLATEWAPFFVVVVNEDRTESYFVALKALFDVSLLYDDFGVKLPGTPEDDEGTTTVAILEAVLAKCIRDLNETPDSDIQKKFWEKRTSLCVEGFCKLILFGRLDSVDDLASLIVLFRSPNSDSAELHEMRWTFATFINAYVAATSLPMPPANLLVAALLKVLRTVSVSHSGSVVTKIKVESLVQEVLDFASHAAASWVKKHATAKEEAPEGGETALPPSSGVVADLCIRAPNIAVAEGVVKQLHHEGPDMRVMAQRALARIVRSCVPAKAVQQTENRQALADLGAGLRKALEAPLDAQAAKILREVQPLLDVAEREEEDADEDEKSENIAEEAQGDWSADGDVVEEGMAELTFEEEHDGEG